LGASIKTTNKSLVVFTLYYNIKFTYLFDSDTTIGIYNFIIEKHLKN